MRRLASVLVAVGLVVPAGCGGGLTQHARPQFETYVALGDSFTAAPRVGTASGPPICNRTAANYPTLVAAAVGASTFVDRSCTGASTADLTRPQHDGVPPQLDAVGPGTDLVTIGIGANDQDLLATILLTCARLGRTDPHGAPCRAELGSTIAARTEPIRAHVVTALRDVRARAPKARIALVGYPQVVPPAGACARLPLATGDYPFVRGVLMDLDRALRAAAEEASATFVDVWQESAGHDVCGSDPWVNGAANLPGLPPPFHPFAEEQQDVARMVVRAVGGAPPSGSSTGS